MDDVVRSGPRMRPVRWSAPKVTPRARETVSAPPMPQVRRIELPGVGPEDVVIAADGFVYTGTADGAILRVDIATGAADPVVNTGGRPLGLHAGADGSLLICDAERGLLRWDGRGHSADVLVDTVGGQPLNFPSNVVQDPDDSTIYFTVSSRRWPLTLWMGDLLEHSGTGQLLRLSPDGAVDVLLDGLQFANGVAFAPDRESLFIAETGAYRLSRYWLRGPKTGERETVLENLPGFPDNIALGSDGLIWVSLASPRNPLLDALHARPGVLRTMLWRLPDRLKPAPKRTAWVLGVDPEGSIVHDLQRDGAGYAMVTSVAEQQGTLILGSLVESAIAVTHLPA